MPVSLLVIVTFGVGTIIEGKKHIFTTRIIHSEMNLIKTEKINTCMYKFDGTYFERKH